MKVLRFIGRGLRLTLRGIGYLIALFILTFLLQRSTYPPGLDWNAISVIVREHHFDYITWEINALATKAGQTLWGVHPFINEEDRSQFVRDYMADLASARSLERRIEAVFIDPAIDDPEEASADLRAERDELRADLRQRQPLMESILEGQVAAVLVDEGFGLFGQLLPPISMHFTRTPNLLIVSPRDEIRFEVSLALDPLPIETINTIENRIEDERDMSALIVPLGGIALFPAMILETTNLSWAVETFAHEWAHHYLFFFPLGLYYEFSGETRIINETVADIFGKEVAELVLRRYYPELAPASPSASDSLQLVHHAPAADDAPFDFGAAMHETRVNVDRIMADIDTIRTKSERFSEAGHLEHAESYDEFVREAVEKAERYMEIRREYFYENGVNIRRLNQAYFAFFGGYQGGIAGIGGDDPIGPAVEDVRRLSPDLPAFMRNMRGIVTRDDLLEVRDRLLREAGELSN